MKRSATRPVKTSDPTTAFLAVDAAGAKWNVYTELGEQLFEGEYENRTDVVERELGALRDRARAAGYTQLVVLCEPSGGCEQVVMKTARRLGLETAWVNTEAVCKLRVVESADMGKTDVKDPRVIHLLGRLQRTQRHRMLTGPYALLRQWHPLYCAAEAGVAAAKSAIHAARAQVFPDFSFKKDFLFGRSGQAVGKCFGFNPYRIVQAGRRRFEEALRKQCPRIQPASIARLWRDAELSVRHEMDERVVALQEKGLAQLFEDLTLHEQRKAEAARAMEQLYAEAQALDPALPAAERGVVTTLHLARILAVVGPLSDFRTSRQLLRFLGLNLRERQSGTYRGQTRLSKKGSSLGRQVLGHCVLPLVKRERLFGPAYHAKREQGMPGNKAMTVMIRRFVKMLFGWYRSGGQFDARRVFVAASQYRQAA